MTLSVMAVATSMGKSPSLTSLRKSNSNCEKAHHQHLRLNDRNQTVSLANGGISGKSHGVLIDGNLRRSSTDGILNVQNSSPLGEASTRLVVFGASDIKVIHALRDTLTIGSEQRLDSLVDLRYMSGCDYDKFV